jgi:hypothetical protein
LELAPKAGAHLTMPRLGEPVEPDHAENVTPWWRVAGGDLQAAETDTLGAVTLPKAMPWPAD